MNTSIVHQEADETTPLTPKDLSDNNKRYLKQRGIDPRRFEAATGSPLSNWIENWHGRATLSNEWSGPKSEYSFLVDHEKKWIAENCPGMVGHPIPSLYLRYQKCVDGIPRARTRYEGDGPWEYTKRPDNFEVDLPRSHRTNATVTVTRRWDTQSGVPSVPWYGPTPDEVLRDPSIPKIITEAPVKAIALLQLGLVAVGKASADSGMHIKETATLSSEARRLGIRGGTFYELADSGQERNPSVANGVARDIVMLTREGGTVRVCHLPEREPVPGKPITDKSFDWGIDDFTVAHRKLHFRCVFGRLKGDLTKAKDGDTEHIEKFRLAESAAWTRSKRLVIQLLNRAVPGWPLDRVRATPKEEREGLLSDLVFVATLNFLTNTELKLVAAEWGRGAKGLLDAAISDFRVSLAKAEEEDAEQYYTQNGVLHWRGLRLCSFDARITAELRRDDGCSVQRQYQIEGTLESGRSLDPVSVPSGEYASMKWIDNEWPAAAYVEAGPALRDHCRTAIQALSVPTTRTIYTATGWRRINGQNVFVMPGGGIGPEGYVEAECDLSRDTRDAESARFMRPELPATDADARSDMSMSGSILYAAPFEISAPLLAMTFLAPLRPLLRHGVDFTLWVHGPSGAMKSTLAAICQGHYGEFGEDLPGRWDDSAATLERRASVHADVIYVVDNLVTPKHAGEFRAMASACGRFLQSIGDGNTRGRQRWTKNGLEDAQRYRPRAGVVSTAETLPPGEGESTYGRILAVHIAKKGVVGVDDVTRLQSVESRRSLRRCMGGYLRWIAAQDWDELRARMRGWVDEYREDYRARHGDAHPRIPTSAALLRVGARMMADYASAIGMDNHVCDGWSARLDDMFGIGIESCVVDQPRVTNARAVDVWLSALRAMLATGVVGLALTKRDPLIAKSGSNKTIPMIGWLAGEEVFLVPEAAFQSVATYLGSRCTFGPSDLHRELLDATTEVDGHPEPVTVLSTYEGMGERTAGRRADTKRTAGPDGKRHRVLCLPRIVLGVSHGSLRAVSSAEKEMTDEIPDEELGEYVSPKPAND